MPEEPGAAGLDGEGALRNDNECVTPMREVLALRAELEHYRSRERHFARLLGVADGGQYRADWDGAVQRLVDERDAAVRRAEAAEARLGVAGGSSGLRGEP